VFGRPTPQASGMTTNLADTEVAAVLAADERRCTAIRERDYDALSATVHDDLTYRHSSGFTEAKAAYLETSVRGRPTQILRPSPLDVTIFGDVAVVKGDYVVKIGPSEGLPDGLTIDADSLQVWVKSSGQWRLFAHQGSMKPAQS
jgi:ketosteroid isomerase-like protein